MEPKSYLTFSLRTLLVTMAAICALVLVPVNRAQRQHAAAKRARSFGGLVWYDYNFPDGNYESENFDPYGKSSYPTWLVSTVGEDLFHNVVYVSLGGTEVTDNELDFVYDIPSLRKLMVHRTEVTADMRREIERRMPDCDVFP